MLYPNLFHTVQPRRLSIHAIIRPRSTNINLSLTTCKRFFVRHSVQSFVDIHPEVEEAIKSQKPVVALESAIITHGMPYPENFETAKLLEKVVRSEGSIPATIGIIAGRIKIGMDPAELQRLADVDKNPSVKISARDIGPCISEKRDGGTTCSATMIFSSLAGIKVFSTGGLGGVHRGGETSMDISADLQTIAKYPVALVSAGVKSILDIGRTLEYLETMGVPVVTYGQSREFPAFYSSKSGFKSPWKVDNPKAAAAIMHNQWTLGIESGILFGVPIPSLYENEAVKIQEAVEEAIKESESNGVSRRGKEVTPWLLNRVKELTKGGSLRSNIALIENTARVGSMIASAYSRSINSEHDVNLPLSQSHASSSEKQLSVDDTKEADLVVIGASAIDVTAQSSSAVSDMNSSSTVPGSVKVSYGGVARNIAEAAHRSLFSKAVHSQSVLLVSPIGNDDFGKLLQQDCEKMGLRTDGLCRHSSERTATCSMFVDKKGSLVGGVADMEIAQKLTSEEAILAFSKKEPKLVAMDANLSSETLSGIIKHCIKNNIATFFEPTSVTKATSILPVLAEALESSTHAKSPVTYISPNLLELSEMYLKARAEQFDLFSHQKWWSIINEFELAEQWRIDLGNLAKRHISNKSSKTLSFLVDEGIAHMAIYFLPYFQNLVIKCGDAGVILVMYICGDEAIGSAWNKERSNTHQVIARSSKGALIILKHFPALDLDPNSIVNVIGAGDSLVGMLCSQLTVKPYIFRDPELLQTVIQNGQKAANLSLTSQNAVSEHLSNA